MDNKSKFNKAKEFNKDLQNKVNKNFKYERMIEASLRIIGFYLMRMYL